MVKKNIKSRDHLLQYCRSLGHRVPFEYCRSLNTNLPCRSILDCWMDVFAVDEWAREIYDEEEINLFLQPAKSKIFQIYDSMLKASGSKRKK